MDGGFGQWSSFSQCSKSCGNGKQTRSRECNDPKPAHEGKDCDGSKTNVKDCKIVECPGK